jgi:hypothetical protein
LEHAVKHQRHFDTREGAQRETVLIWKMVSELNRSVELLNADITAEEERARIFDRSDAAYPILAESLAARRGNLLDTIAALKDHLHLDRAEPVAEVA